MIECPNCPTDKKPTYRVEYKQIAIDDSISAVHICCNIPSVELAVKLALSIHEMSNSEHTIHVMHDDIIDCTFIKY